jgi:IMP dehydrogenase
MAKIVEGVGLTFDDVLLVPRFSKFGSRFNGEISLDTEILPGLKLQYPLVSANMDTVTTGPVAQAMERLGGLGIVHRFMSPSEQVKELLGLTRSVVCIGVGQEGIDRLITIRDFIPALTAVLIDIAHGDSSDMLKQIGRVKNLGYSVIAGNIATADAAKRLWEAGAACVKVGVGGGSLCTTRIQTGCGVPQLTAIMNVVEVKPDGKTLIADGGIKFSGDIAKAIGAGASSVMLGNLLAGTDEAPGEVVMYQGRAYKTYRGMGSLEAMKEGKSLDRYFQDQVSAEDKLVPEGIEGRVPYKGSTTSIVQMLVGGLKAGMGYAGCRSIPELQAKAKFIKITQASLKESHVHDVVITKEAPNYHQD